MPGLKQQLYHQLWQYPEIYAFRIMLELGSPWKDSALHIFSCTKRMSAEKKRGYWRKQKSEVDAAFEIWYSTGKKSFED